MYTARILLRGDVKNFSDKNVEVIGQVKFRGAAERGEFIVPSNAEAAENFTLDEKDFKIFLDGAEISADKLRKI